MSDNLELLTQRMLDEPRLLALAEKERKKLTARACALLARWANALLFRPFS